MTHLSEADLVDHCRRHSRPAQYELYRRYSDAMFATCLRMCRCREDAEDVLQHSFSDVFGKLHHFRGESTVGAWIKRIVINNCLNELKRRRHRLLELTDQHAPAAEPEPEEDYRAEIYTVERIKTAVATLPDGFRTVLTLYLFEGFDHAEIASCLEISEQTSKSQYSRARRRLREQLTQAHSQ